MSEVRPQLLITLVHGTWPRGFFRTFFPRLVRFKQRVRELTRRQSRDPPPFWFEEHSPFLTRLREELSDVPHKIKPLLWSGANSIYVRDKTAQALAEHLSAEHAEHPQDTQLIIAHSHGGNIALRALHHLQKHDASRSDGSESANPLVVTLATPFIEIHQADFGHRPSSIRFAVLVAMWWLLQLLTVVVFPSAHSNLPMSTPTELSPSYSSLIFHALVTFPMVFIGWYWIKKRPAARQTKVQALSGATRLGEAVAPQRLLVIRAIDDEASLILALGAILNYITVKFIMLVYWIMATLPVSVLLGLIFVLIYQRSPVNHGPTWYIDVVGLLCSAFIVMLFGVLAASRLVHGGELAKSPMECQINTQSAPDAIDLSQIVTLIWNKYVKTLRHGIYEHDNCAHVISDWVRSQLCASPVR
jgi:hypothetical protein